MSRSADHRTDDEGRGFMRQVLAKDDNGFSFWIGTSPEGERVLAIEDAQLDWIGLDVTVDMIEDFGKKLLEYARIVREEERLAKRRKAAAKRRKRGAR